MSNLNPLTSFSNAPEVMSGKKSTGGVADNFDMFLKILTTQLRNQNPLDPLDTHQFTQQLVQFSSVEQAVKQNTQLETLNKLMLASASSNAVSYIGNGITADGTVNYLRGGSAEWIIAAGRSGTANIQIKDASGNLVREINMDIESGPNNLKWDGRSNSGMALPDGRYSITVNAKNALNAPIPAETRLKGKVDGVDFSTGEPLLQIGDMYVPISLVGSVVSYN